MNVIDVVWFTPAPVSLPRTLKSPGCIGIILIDVTPKGVEHEIWMKSYIGWAPGINFEVDLQRLSDWGARFPDKAAEALFAARIESLRENSFVLVKWYKER